MSSTPAEAVGPAGLRQIQALIDRMGTVTLYLTLFMIGLARIFHQHQVGGLVPKRVFIGI